MSGGPPCADRRGRAAAVLVLVVAAVVAACGSSGSDVTEPAPSATVTTAPAATTTTPTTTTSKPTTPRPSGPVGTTRVPDDLRPSLATADDDEPVIYTDGCHLDRETTAPDGCVTGPADAPRVVLFGDSHAAQWYSAFERLADDGRIELDSRTKSSCPSVEAEAVIPDDGDGQPYPACDEWRHNVVADLVDDPPAVVVLANFSTSYNREDPRKASKWTAAIRTTVRELPRSTRIVVVADTPRPGTTPVPCLDKHRDDTTPCEKTRADMLDPEIRKAESRGVAGTDATYVDLTDALCNRRTCPMIIGRTLVYRDQHHLSAVMSASLSGRWRQALARVGTPID